jgi:hypothetical protein
MASRHESPGPEGRHAGDQLIAWHAAKRVAVEAPWHGTGEKDLTRSNHDTADQDGMEPLDDPPVRHALHLEHLIRDADLIPRKGRHRLEEWGGSVRDQAESAGPRMPSRQRRWRVPPVYATWRTGRRMVGDPRPRGLRLGGRRTRVGAGWGPAAVRLQPNGRRRHHPCAPIWAPCTRLARELRYVLHTTMK